MDCNSDINYDTNSYSNVVSDDEHQLISNFNKMSLNHNTHNFQSQILVPKQLEQPFSISFEYRLYQLLSNLEIIDLLSNELDPILDSFCCLFIAIRDNQKSAKNYIKLLNCAILPNSFNYQEIYKFMTLNINDINKYWEPINQFIDMEKIPQLNITAYQKARIFETDDLIIKILDDFNTLENNRDVDLIIQILKNMIEMFDKLIDIVKRTPV